MRRNGAREKVVRRRESQGEFASRFAAGVRLQVACLRQLRHFIDREAVDVRAVEARRLQRRVNKELTECNTDLKHKNKRVPDSTTSRTCRRRACDTRQSRAACLRN